MMGCFFVKRRGRQKRKKVKRFSVKSEKKKHFDPAKAGQARLSDQKVGGKKKKVRIQK